MGGAKEAYDGGPVGHCFGYGSVVEKIIELKTIGRVQETALSLRAMAMIMRSQHALTTWQDVFGMTKDDKVCTGTVLGLYHQARDAF